MDAIAQQELLKFFQENSYLYGGNAPFVEALYGFYLKDPFAVSEDWRQYFEQMRQSQPDAPADVDHDLIRTTILEKKLSNLHTKSKHVVRRQASSQSDDIDLEKQVAVLQLINAYRYRGHQCAKTDPLTLRTRQAVPDLNPQYHHLTDADLDCRFSTGSLVGPDKATLREILHVLREIYCGSIGAEYMHITHTLEKRWIQSRFERPLAKATVSRDTKLRVLERIVAASMLEQYLHFKYVGQKRFSLEGAEALIPLLDELIQRSGHHDIKEIVLGMAHRGRLNVLVNILGKSTEELFREFEGKFDKSTNLGSGDVKYHQGFSCDVDSVSGPIHVTLAFNPSHLEIIDPVVEGSVRARQNRRKDYDGEQAIPVLIHGDAAFAGQGVVMETLQMSQARGFRTGGTVHIIINNQIGFTTSNPLDIRSTPYCTEVAKIVQAPIFHVNGDDPEAVINVTQIALDYRMEFKKDVVIDLICFRRHGHNESDEPKATQPMMYKNIDEHRALLAIYGEQLIDEKVVDAAHIKSLENSYRDALDEGQVVARKIRSDVKIDLIIDWTYYDNASWKKTVDTRLPVDVVKQLARRVTAVPAEFDIHPSVEKVLQNRRKVLANGHRIDWGFAETLAYASLLKEGYAIRLVGQDSARGTFFHRHAVIHNQENGDTYVPLHHIADEERKFVVVDSLLSEEAVLGFEYGYSSTDPNTLVIWEAQFGDFANGAQVVIDQFITSGEIKWGRYCGITLFLPHGYDGQGPEHSSARLERYLSSCAQDNIQVCVPSLPAQMFHLLRRQMLRPLRKPLIVMTPKSLLRHKLSTSSLEDLSNNQFLNVIGEIDALDYSKVKRVVVCSGKIYFELIQARRERKLDEIAIVRMEQLYPFPEEDVVNELQRYPNAEVVVWCQEEPRNQGAWRFIMKRLIDCLGSKQTVTYSTRPPSPSPASGYLQQHIASQREVIDQALKL